MKLYTSPYKMELLIVTYRGEDMKIHTIDENKYHLSGGHLVCLNQALKVAG